MAISWMKLDNGFWHDEKFLAIIHRKGEAAAFKVIKLYCLAHSKYGTLDLNEPNIRPWVEEEMGLKGKRLDEFLSVCAECRLIEPEMLAIGKITSERLSKEGLKRRTTEEARSVAGEASAEARRNKC